MFPIIKLFLFCVSNIGWWERIRRNSRINVYFIPSLTIAVQTTIMFLAGLLNLLSETMWFLYVAGWFGVAYSIYKDQDFSFLKNYLNDIRCCVMAETLQICVRRRWRI